MKGMFCVVSVIPAFTDVHTHTLVHVRAFYACVKQVYWLLQCDSPAAGYTTVLLFPVPSLCTSSPPSTLLPPPSLRPSVRPSVVLSSLLQPRPGSRPFPAASLAAKHLPSPSPSRAPLSAPVGSAASVLACSSAASASLSELSSPALSSLTLRSVPVGAQGRVKGSTKSCRGGKAASTPPQSCKNLNARWLSLICFPKSRNVHSLLHFQGSHPPPYLLPGINSKTCLLRNMLTLHLSFFFLLPACLVATCTAVAGAQKMHIRLIYSLVLTEPEMRQDKGCTEAAHS